VFVGIMASGSSDSNSSSGGAESATGCAWAAGTGLGRRGVGIGAATGCGGGVAVEVFSSGSGAGESSIVECLPVVHGGIDMNSSNVRTRGLQHFQPVQCRSASAGKVGLHAQRVNVYLFGLRGIWEDLDGKSILLQDL